MPTTPEPLPPSVLPAPPDGARGPNIRSRSQLIARLGALAEVVLCSSLPTQFVLGALIARAGVAPIDAAGRLALPFVLALSIGDTVLLLLLMTAISRTHGESVRTLWLGQRPARREAALGVLLIPLVFALVVSLLGAIRTWAPWLHNVDQNPLEGLATSGPVQAAVFALVAIVAGGLREELQRAFLLRRFEQHLGGAAVGVVALSVAFGLGHYVQGWDAAVTTGALGAFWAVLYLRRRSSVAPVVSHAGFNSAEIARVLVFGGG